MKKIILIAAVAAVSACDSYITPELIAAHENVCDKNDGTEYYQVYSISISNTIVKDIKCNNGAIFTREARNETKTSRRPH